MDPDGQGQHRATPTAPSLANTASIATNATTDPDQPPTTARRRPSRSTARPTSRSTKTAAPDPVIAGTNVTYTVKVEQPRPVRQRRLHPDRRRPGRHDLRLGASAGLRPGRGTVTCTSDGLAGGGSVTWTIVGQGRRARSPTAATLVEHGVDRHHRTADPSRRQRQRDRDHHGQPLGRPQGRPRPPRRIRSSPAPTRSTRSGQEPRPVRQRRLHPDRRRARPARPSCRLERGLRPGGGTVTCTSAGLANGAVRDLDDDGQGRPRLRRRHDLSNTASIATNGRPTRPPPTTARRRPSRSTARPTCRSPRATPRPGHRRHQPDLHHHRHQRRPVRRPGGQPQRRRPGRHDLRVAATGGWTCSRRPSARPAPSPAPAPTLAAGAERDLHPRGQGQRQRGPTARP